MAPNTPSFVTLRPKHDLRDYQLEVVAQFESALADKRNCLIVAPTGSGKSNLCASAAALVLAKNGRTIIVCPTKELVAQNASAVVSQIPFAPLSVACAGLGQRDTSQAIIVGTPGTLANMELPPVDLVLIDEAHSVCSARKDSRVNQIIKQVKDANAKALVFGATATDYRLDSGRLSDHSGVWSRVDHEIKYIELMRRGYLAPIVGPGSKIKQLDVGGVRRLGSKGDFIEADLDRAINTSAINQQIANEIIKHGEGRKAWLIFAVGVAHCEALARALNSLGANVDFVHGGLKDKERDEKIERFKRGELRGLVNVAILTTGFDYPAIDLLAMARPTCSPSLMVQMIGRSTRPSPGKSDALILDFAGNFSRCGSFDAPIVIDKNAKQAEAKATTKECPHCHFITSAAASVCPRCDEEFPREEQTKRLEQLRAVAANVEPLSGAEVRHRNALEVVSVTYAGHRSSKNPLNRPSLRVTYRTRCGQLVSEWLCCWHDGQFGRSARAEWNSRLKPGLRVAPPVDAYAAAVIAGNVLRAPKFIRKVQKTSGFTTAVPVEFAVEPARAGGR